MDFKVGDIVKFLNEVGGGKITKILDEKTVLVEIEDGFEFPYLKSELIKLDDDTEQQIDYQKVKQPKSFNQIEQDLTSQQQEPEIIKDNEDINIYLAIVPDKPLNPKLGNFEIILINDSNWYLLYLFEFKKDLYISYPGILQPNYQEIITTLNFEELQQIEQIDINILLYRTQPHYPQNPIRKKLTIQSYDFEDKFSFKENEFLDQRAKIFKIVERNPVDEAIEKDVKQKNIKEVVQQKEIKNKKLNTKRQYRSPKQPELVEVDLHITELVEDTTGWTAKQMLEYQLKVFREKLEEAIKNPHIKKIVFIHGRGNGKLRQEIRKQLQQKGIKYQDASLAKYGFGATMAFVSKRFYSKNEKFYKS